MWCGAWGVLVGAHAALEGAGEAASRVSRRRRSFSSSSRFLSKCFTQLGGQAFSYAFRRARLARRAALASKQAKYASRACA